MEFSYTGQYRFSGDAKGDWTIECLSSGTLRFSRLGRAGRGVDLFCLGGGGGGGRSAQFGYGGGGGGGGKTKTVRGAKIARGAAIDIIIGSGGAPPSASHKLTLPCLTEEVPPAALGAPPLPMMISMAAPLAILAPRTVFVFPPPPPPPP